MFGLSSSLDRFDPFIICQLAAENSAQKRSLYYISVYNGTLYFSTCKVLLCSHAAFPVEDVTITAGC